MSMSKNFGLIGASGYVAPRHMKAIFETGHRLIAAYDPFDSVGVIDRYFPEADFFVEYERFDRHLEKKKRQGKGIDYLSICSPNYLHDAHIRFGMRLGADVICEKPLVLNPWNVDALQEIALETGQQVYNILQLRLHPSVIALRERIKNGPSDHIYEIDLTYITSRGHWYYTSWKGDLQKSGGIATNIGVHFFDMLIWIFGEVKENIVHQHSHDRAAGYLVLEKARVRWFLSINANTLPVEARQAGKTTWRSLSIGGEEFEFSDGFADLHTLSYEAILKCQGYPLLEARPAIEIVHKIRHQKPDPSADHPHPFTGLAQEAHPFNTHS